MRVALIWGLAECWTTKKTNKLTSLQLRTTTKLCQFWLYKNISVALNSTKNEPLAIKNCSGYVKNSRPKLTRTGPYKLRFNAFAWNFVFPIESLLRNCWKCCKWYSVFKWHKLFSEDREVIGSLPHASRSSSSVNDDNIEKVRKTVHEKKVSRWQQRIWRFLTDQLNRFWGMFWVWSWSMLW